MNRLHRELYPIHVILGNGEELSLDLLKDLQIIERELTRYHPWNKGELLIIDNLRVAHGHLPFEGNRVH